MPRSPSRDRADRFVGNRGYFKQPDAIRRAKNWLALAALGLTGGWAILDAATPQKVVSTHTHGQVAAVHAGWNDKCEACHKPSSPSQISPVSLFRAGDRWLDLTCERCHSGPAHHAAVVNGKALNDRCESCHHDHNGRDNSLVSLTDSHCTNCHADLPVHSTAGGYHNYPAAEKIKSFLPDGGHPEFRELALYPQDKAAAYGPRTLKFSHAVHLNPGQAYRKDGRQWTLAEIADPVARDRYRVGGQSDADPVQLKCESCHQLDSGFAAAGQPGGDEFARKLKPLADQPKKSVLPPRAPGTYYLPVNFDAHCKACHPLDTLPTQSGEFAVGSFAVPHRKQPGELKRMLQGEYSSRLLFPEGKVETPAGPGGRLDPRATPDGPANFRDETARLADAALKNLLLGAAKPNAPRPGGFSGSRCDKCHGIENPTAKPDEMRVAAVPDKTVWFPHAKFEHIAHRSTACAECHPGSGVTYQPDGVTVAFTEREPIRIRGVEFCRACHSTAGGVRHGCTDCHTYHDGDHPFRGPGTAARNPAVPLTVEQFLSGGPPRTP
jgi:hypothetical protein